MHAIAARAIERNLPVPPPDVQITSGLFPEKNTGINPKMG
jgi:hypothetical protein